MLPWLCSVIDQRWRQNVLKTKKWQTSRRLRGECVTDVFTPFWRLLWSITEQTHAHTCLVPLDCSRICQRIRHFFKSQTLLFVSPSSFIFFVLFVNSFFEKFFNVFTCSKQNYGENILQNSECLVAMTQGGNCCEVFLRFRHSQVVKNSSWLRFSIFLLCK